MTFRLSVIELSLNNSTSTLLLRECSDLNEARTFFITNPQIADQRIERVFQEHLGAPEEFFAEHTTQGPSFTTDESHIRSSWLPSSMPAEESFHQDLFCMWLYTGRTQDIQWPCSKSGLMLCPGDEGLELRCDATGRELQFYELKSRPEGRRWLMIVPQRCSYWSNRHGENGWDAVILCDPPPTHALVNGTGGPVNVTRRIPFNGGYREFIPPAVVREGAISENTRQALDLIPVEPGEFDAQRARRYHAVNDRRRVLQEQLDSPSPPRLSMFEDLRYYFCRHAKVLENREHPSCATLFPLKLIASHFCVVHDFVAFQTAKMRSTGWNLRRETAEQVRAAQEVETAWSRFRCTEYLEAVTAMLDTLGAATDEHHTPPYFYDSFNSIYRRGNFFDGPYRHTPTRSRERPAIEERGRAVPPDAATSHYSSDWKSPINDFIFLHRQFTLRREDYDRITTSIAALAGIIAGRLGIDEAKTAKALTFVAMCFAPLSWVSGIYSMEVFGPDGPFFWQYWLTALPTMFAVWGVFFVWKYKWWAAALSFIVRRWLT
ncbi:hypothetical protein B0T16DRAFT_458952 [Cercophora newfieldiana]|uniref:Uncharacterized protein n=1 Tax=Cercophora newfieldiana TaxID=92897 RepID=A0AA40CQ81_9PEZI|nr:hypothetical protein B0T16DRAFT_458952 [Cercophora newfieldiana]